MDACIKVILFFLPLNREQSFIFFCKYFFAFSRTISKKYVDISNVEASLESTDEIIRKLYAEHIESVRIFSRLFLIFAVALGLERKLNIYHFLDLLDYVPMKLHSRNQGEFLRFHHYA